jgi:hypothetical protein
VLEVDGPLRKAGRLPVVSMANRAFDVVWFSVDQATSDEILNVGGELRGLEGAVARSSNGQYMAVGTRRLS